MKKKGFTLVELLAVIAILAILVIIALPNVMKLFNDAKKNSFTNEVKEIYKTAQQQWMSESMNQTSEKMYGRETAINCEATELDLSGRTQIKYGIKLNKSGEVVNYVATDGTYAYQYSSNTPLTIDSIGSASGNTTDTFNSILVLSEVGKDTNAISCPSGEFILDWDR